MSIVWTRTDARDEYYYGVTNTRFSAQIGLSANAGKYVWMIFHEDFCGCVVGEEAGSLDAAKQQAEE